MKKKLSLKNLKVFKLSDQEKSNVEGGGDPGKLPSCKNSGLNSCNDTSAWPINCNSTLRHGC
ncbi:hypothetical protein [Flavobacterium collinsii]|jgi:hypothetical protein|uniref:Uncharacterized protein n=1 Tax=Flavobacterium collinsii TaxID=1114861 RepID=A0ABN7ERE8_9FLAO|nr:hypothetical protein [Flavobacterium collinsii]CAA9203428.1 hypothetical protein FLACOL7796_04739 [Flavobacterium collinsii]